METKETENAYHFWCRVDELREKRELREIAATSGLKYKSILVQRSNSTYPKAMDLVALANVLETTVDYLLTGKRAKNSFMYELFKAYKKADGNSRTIVDIALNLQNLTDEDKGKVLA